MELEHEVLSLFPTPLYTNIVPEQLIKDYIPYLDQEELLKKSKPDTDEYGVISKNTYLLDKKEYVKLSNYILQHVTFYITNYFLYSYQNYKFSQSWISVKNPNQEHRNHTHSNSLISGVLFYGDYKDNTSRIFFHRRDNYSDTIHQHPQNHNNVNMFSGTTLSLSFESNLLLLFPSSLEHSVSKNITNIPRKSLAFNIVPEEGFGSEMSLNKLKIN